MTLKNSVLLFLSFISLSLAAQINPKSFNTVHYEEKVFECDDYKLYIAGSFSRAEILKIKLRIFNKSKNIIYIKPREIQFTVNNKTVYGTGRVIIVQPEGDESQLIDITGEGDMRYESFDITLNGIYKIDTNGEVIKAENTEVDGKSGTNVAAPPFFKCDMLTGQANKEKSFAKYSCVYTGDKIGVIEPNNTVAIMSSGRKNYNSYPKNELFILEKNQPETITIEFRKLNGAGDLTDGYKVMWDNVFKVTAPVAYPAQKTAIHMDINKSK